MGTDDTLRPFIEKFDYEQLDLEDTKENDVSKHSKTRPRTKAKLANIMISLLSFVCLIASAIVYRKARMLSALCGNEDILLQSKINYAHKIKISIPFETIQVNSAPLSSNESIYRQAPSPLVDAAWDRLGDIGTHIISSSDILDLGKDPKKAVKVPKDWGYGDDAHIATLDGIHLVHCLNSMRKSLKLNFDYYHPDPLGPEYLPHLSHCVEAVLQHLMCRPSMELLTHNWIERQNAPFPDFGINKKCWNYEAILDWKDKNRVLDIETRFSELKPPVGMLREPLPPLVDETWQVIDAKENGT